MNPFSLGGSNICIPLMAKALPPPDYTVLYISGITYLLLWQCLFRYYNTYYSVIVIRLVLSNRRRDD